MLQSAAAVATARSPPFEDNASVGPGAGCCSSLVGTASLRRASPRRRYPDYDRYKDWPAAAWTLHQCTEPLLPLYPRTLARRYRAPRRAAEVFPRSGAQPSRLTLRLRFIKPNEAHDLAAILAALSRVGLTPSISCRGWGPFA